MAGVYFTLSNAQHSAQEEATGRKDALFVLTTLVSCIDSPTMSSEMSGIFIYLLQNDKTNTEHTLLMYRSLS